MDWRLTWLSIILPNNSKSTFHPVCDRRINLSDMWKPHAECWIIEYCIPWTILIVILSCCYVRNQSLSGSVIDLYRRPQLHSMRFQRSTDEYERYILLAENALTIPTKVFWTIVNIIQTSAVLCQHCKSNQPPAELFMETLVSTKSYWGFFSSILIMAPWCLSINCLLFLADSS